MRLLLICLLTLLPMTALAQSDNGQPEGTISVVSDAAQDAAIATRIRQILRQLDGYEDVTVAVTEGIVTLSGSALDAGQIASLTGLVARIEGVVAIENEVQEATDVVQRLNPAVARMRARVDQMIAFAPLIAIAITVGGLTVWLGYFLARRSWPWDRIAPNPFIADIYRQLVRLAFAIAGVVLMLDLLNATALLGTILGAAGIAGLAIGFAVRDTVENFISSIMLSVRQPFRPKDLVEIEGDMGHVIRLTSRATILLSPEGNHIRIPNATVFKAKIINYTRNDERRFDFTLGIDPAADIAEAQAIMLAALTELPFVLQTPAPGVWVDGVEASTLDITAAGWIMQHQTDIGMAKGEAIRVVKARLEEAGIALPGPSLRLLATPSEAPTADRPRPPRQPGATTVPVEARDVGAGEKAALETLVEAEREALPDDDLLRREAPQE